MLTTKQEELIDEATAAFEELVENFFKDADEKHIFGESLEEAARALADTLTRRIQAELVDAF